jgi:hypothetical protein
MKKQTKTILFVVLGVFVVSIVVFISTAVIFFRSAVQNTQVDQNGAERAFTETLARFTGEAPVLEIRAGEVVLMRAIPAEAPTKPPSTLHVLAWEPDENNLARLALPMWLVRMSDDPVSLRLSEGITIKTGTELRPQDLEKFGPSLVLDHQERDGSRVVLWTD